MLVFQVVDFHAAKEACSFQVEWAAKGKALSLTPYDIGLPGIDSEVELGPKSFMENILYPFQTSLWVYMVALMMTLLLFPIGLPTLILLMAGMVYPFKQLPPVPGMKSRWRSR